MNVVNIVYAGTGAITFTIVWALACRTISAIFGQEKN